MRLISAIQTVEKTIQKSQEVFAPKSEWEPILSTRLQLQYILEALKNSQERSRLKDLTIGLYAVREFETDHEEFANMIYKTVEIVELMKKGKL